MISSRSQRGRARATVLAQRYFHCRVIRWVFSASVTSEVTGGHGHRHSTSDMPQCYQPPQSSPSTDMSQEAEIAPDSTNYVKPISSSPKRFPFFLVKIVKLISLNFSAFQASVLVGEGAMRTDAISLAGFQTHYLVK